MKTIWKYSINPRQNKIQMPSGAQILSIQTQRGEPQLWALVDPNNKKETRILQVYGTGWDMPEFPGKYLGSFQVEKETLIFHVFDLTDQG